MRVFISLQIFLSVHTFPLAFTLECDLFIERVLSSCSLRFTLGYALGNKQIFKIYFASNLCFNLWNVFLRVFRFFVVSVIQPMLHNSFYFNIILAGTKNHGPLQTNQCLSWYPETLDRKTSSFNPRRSGLNPGSAIVVSVVDRHPWNRMSPSTSISHCQYSFINYQHQSSF